MSKCRCQSCPSAGRLDRPARRRIRLPWSIVVFLMVAAGVLLLDFMDARAGVYHSRESALELAFPEADSVTTWSVTLSREQAARAATRAGAELPSRLLQIYEAWENGAIQSYGLIETHRVRSLPETLLVVVGADGEVSAVHLLAFHEPEQYRASAKWLGQFAGLPLDRDMAPGRGIAGIAGSTLTANAVTAAVRRSVAALQVVLKLDTPDPSAGEAP